MATYKQVQELRDLGYEDDQIAEIFQKTGETYTPPETEKAPTPIYSGEGVSGIVGDVARGAERGLFGIPGMIGKGARYVGLDSVGDLTDKVDDYVKNTPEVFSESKASQESDGGLRALPYTVGKTAGELVPTLTVPGALLPKVASRVAIASEFGLSAAQDAYEAIDKKDPFAPEADKQKYAALQGVINSIGAEAGGEIFGKAFRGVIPPAVEGKILQTITNSLSSGEGMAQAVKAGTSAALEMAGVMAAQKTASGALAHNEGLGPEVTASDIVKGVPADLATGLILHGVGRFGASQQMKALRDTAVDMNAKPQDRADAVVAIAKTIEPQNKELATGFVTKSLDDINNGRPLSFGVDADYVSPKAKEPPAPTIADISNATDVGEAIDAAAGVIDSISAKADERVARAQAKAAEELGLESRDVEAPIEGQADAAIRAAQAAINQPTGKGIALSGVSPEANLAEIQRRVDFDSGVREKTPEQLQAESEAAWNAQTEAALAANRRANAPKPTVDTQGAEEQARRDATIKAEQDRLMTETPESVPPLSPEQQFEQESLAYRQRQNAPKAVSETPSVAPVQPVKLADRIQAERANRAAAEIEAGMKSAPESEPPVTKDPELLDIERMKAESLAHNQVANTRQQADLFSRMADGAVENDANAMVDRANLRKNREMDRLVADTERENNEREWRANGWMSPAESLREDARLSVEHRKEAEAAVTLDPIRKLGAEISRAKINVKQFDHDYPGARAEITKTFPTMFTKKGGTTIDTFAGRADHPEFVDGESIVKALREVQPRNAAVDKYIADNPLIKPHRQVNDLVEAGFRMPEKSDHKWGDFEAGDSLTVGGEQHDVVGKTADGVEVQVGNRFETYPADSEVRPEYVKKFDPTAEKPMPEDWLVDEKKPEENQKDAESIRADEGQVQERGAEREVSQDQGGEDLQREPEAQPSSGNEERSAEGDRGAAVEDTPFAKAESDAEPGLTHEAIHAEGRESLGQGYDRLTKSGKLEVVDTLGDKMPDGSTPIKDENMRAVGFYYKGKITLIADAIRAGEVDGILRHEGLHLLMREDKSFMRAKADILADFKALRETSEAVKAAYDKVPDSTPDRLVDEEALAYFAGEHGNVRHGIVRRMITAVKMWLMKHGLPTGRFSTEDILGMVDRGLRVAGESNRLGEEGPLYDKRPEVTVESLDKEKEDAKGFVKRDLAPAAKTLFTGLDDARKGVIKLFAAGNLNADSRLAADTMIEHMGAAKGEKARYENTINEISEKYSKNTGVAAKLLDEMQTSAGLLADKKIGKMSTKELIDLVQAWDTTGKHEDPEIQAWMAATQEMFDAKRDAIRDIDPHLLEMVRESYLPHILASKTDIPAAAIALAKVPIEGSKNFTHKRVFDDIEALHKAGLKLESYNPFDLVALKMAEMDKFIIAHSTAKELAANEAVNFHEIPASEKTPSGLVDVGSKYMTVTKDVPSTKREFINSLIGQGLSKDEAYAYAAKSHANGEPYTKPEKYRYVASPEIGHVFKNYMSSTLYNNEYGGSLFKAYMGVGHTMNSFQLLSGFHVGVVSTEAVVAKLGSGIADILNGEVSRGVKGVLSSPAAPFTTFMSGDKALQAYLSKTPAPEMAHIVKWLELAGAQKGMDKRFQGSTTTNMLQEWANGNKIGAAIRAPFAVVEQLTRPITEYLVPRMKFGAFVHQVDRWTADHPGATHEELRSASQAAWDHTEALLGQVAYDRIFMHNAAKNAIQATIRAPGWTGGTLVLFGKAAKDTAMMAKNLATGKAPGKVSASQGHVIGLAVFAAVVNGMMTKLLTGEDPKGMDFLAFRDGGVDKNGAATRYVLPTYMRDAFSYSQDWVKTLSNKTNPAIGLVSDIIKNRDFYGTEIRGRDDKAMKQISDLVGYAVKQFTPFSIRAVQESQKRGTSSLGKTLAAQVGITPASSEYTKTPLMKFIQEDIAHRAPAGGRTHEQAAKSELVRDLTTRLRNHDSTALSDLQEARNAKKLSLRDTTTIRQNSRLTPLQISFKKLSLVAAEKAYSLANTKEKLELIRILREKRAHG